MIELKLVAYDRYEAVYSWKGLSITGRNFEGDYVFYFPEADQLKIMKGGYNYESIMRKYVIPTYGEDIHAFFKNTAKKELEKELTRLMQDDLNQNVLIMSLMEGLLIINK